MAGDFQEVGVRAVVQGYADYMTKTKAMDKAVAGMASGFGVMAKGAVVGTAALAGVAAMGGMIVKSAIGASAQMETYTTQFKVLLGGADEAKERIGDLAKFAAETPFELPEIVQASKLLQTFGGTALATGDTLTLVGDMAAASGGSFGELATWVGRAYTNIQGGRPFGEAAMRLQELGLMSGETRNKLEELTKSGADSATVWAAFTGSMSKYKGMMVDLSQTFTGLTSTMSDSWSELMRQFGGPIMEPAKDVVRTIIAFLANPAVVAGAKNMGEALGGVVQQLADLGSSGAADAAERLGSVLTGIADKLKTIDLEAFFTAIGDPEGTLAALVDVLIALGESFGKLGVSMGSALMPLLPKMLDALAPLIEAIASCPPLVNALAYAFLALKLQPIIGLFGALASMILTRVIPATVAQTAALTAQQIAAERAAAANAALRMSLIGGVGIAAALGLATVYGIKWLEANRDAIDQLPILGGLVRGNTQAFKDYATAVRDADSAVKQGLLTTEEAAKQKLVEAESALLKAAQAYAALAEAYRASNAEMLFGPDMRAFIDAEGDINHFIEVLYNLGATYPDVVRILNASGIEFGDVHSKVLTEMGEGYGRWQALIQKGEQEDSATWRRMAAGVGEFRATADENLAGVGKSADEMAKENAAAADKTQQAYEKVKSAVASVLPTVDETYDEWKKRLDNMALAYTAFPETLRQLNTLFRAAGVENADALIDALILGITQEGPEAAIRYLRFFSEIPLAELKARAPAFGGVVTADTAAMVNAFLTGAPVVASAAGVVADAVVQTIATRTDALVPIMGNIGANAGAALTTQMFGQVAGGMASLTSMLGETPVTTSATSIADQLAALAAWTPPPSLGGGGGGGGGGVDAAAEAAAEEAELVASVTQDLIDMRDSMRSAAEEGAAVLTLAIQGEEAGLVSIADALQAATDEHAALERQLQDSTAEVNRWKDASLAGTKAYSDALFGLSQKSDKLQLSLNNIKLQVLTDDFKEGEKASDKLNKMLQALASSLGVDVGKNVTWKEYNELLDAAADKMDVLRLKSENVNLQENLKLDPLRRQLEEIFNPTKEYSFDEIVAGYNEYKAAVDSTTGALAANEAQQIVLEEMQKDHARYLEDLKAAYADLQTALGEIDPAIKEIWETRQGPEVLQSIEDVFAEIDKGNKDSAQAAMDDALALFDKIKREVAAVAGPPAANALMAPIEKVLSDVEFSVETDMSAAAKSIGADVGEVETAVEEGFGDVMRQTRDWTVSWLGHISGQLLELTTIRQTLTPTLDDILDAVKGFTAAVPAAQCGMDVARTGLALVHAGETIVPPDTEPPPPVIDRIPLPRPPTGHDKWPSGRGGGDFNANINVTDRGSGDEIARALRSIAFSLRRP